MTGGAAGQFRYASLANPVKLQANTAYYLMSQETAGGDPWYEYGPVRTTNAGMVNGPVYWDGANWVPVAIPDNSYVPVSFLYGAGISDTPPPTTSITAPASGASVSGNNVAVTATASDNVGVAGVQFKVDGNNLGTEQTTSPYTVTLDTTTLTNGLHILTRAEDSWGGTLLSGPPRVQSEAGMPDTTFETCSPIPR